MFFEKTHIYHIYNRGNNSQQIFYKRENYLFFLEKINQYIKPHCDIIAWCLMPDHFHLMVQVNDVEIDIMSRTQSEGFTLSETLTSHVRQRTLNQSLGIMLRSYTRAIQKQQKSTGSLFQKETKAICLSQIDGIAPTWFQSNYGTMIKIVDPEKEYPQVCFNYIHMNPVNDGLV